MTTPLLELEGTWEEITEKLSKFADLTGRDRIDQKLHVLIYSAEERAREASDTRPIADVLAGIAASIPAEELAKLPSDFTDQLDHYIYGTPKQ